MADLRPFRAYRPRRELASQVASPPYDVLNSAEAREMARDNPLSFLHVVKPEIDLPPDTDVHSPQVYAKGAENLRRLIDEGVLVRDPTPCFYAYEQKMGEHVQVGLVAGASVDEYDRNEIKKHEHTRPEKENDRTRHLDALNANTGPVFLTYVQRDTVDGIIDEVRRGTPEYEFTAPDGIGHRLWVIDDRATIAAIREEFAKVGHLYVADGHHRSASASRVAAGRRTANPAHTGEEGYNFFLTVIFPHDQMKILDYNRVVADLRGHTEEGFLGAVGERFEVAETDSPRPRAPREFGMYVGGRWYRLVAQEGSFPEDDPVNSLDVAILQNNLLNPVLGIENPRTDERIDFVGGIRGLGELEKRVAEGAAVAFALHPTGIRQLMAIADAGEVMPPKSTWFEPKLRSGLIVRPLEGNAGEGS
jgi:uncharacterized protein (DUF1015 family)